jgi:mono/diheme cytochrome c family protein
MRVHTVWASGPLLFLLLFSNVAVARGSRAVGLTGNAKRGKQLYQRYCVSCHGARGDGKGENAVHLDPKPKDFTAGTSRSDDDLYNLISRGVRSTAMPSWNPLTRQDRVDLVAYLKSFPGDSKNRNSSQLPAKTTEPFAVAQGVKD